MIIDALTIEEQAYTGFSHQALITFADLAALPAGNTGTFTIGAVAAQDIVVRAAMAVDTNFTFSDGTLLSCTVSAGDSINGVTSLLAAQQVEAGASPIVATVAAVALAFAATGTITATVTGTAAKNLNTATAGQLRILFSKNKLSKFALA